MTSTMIPGDSFRFPATRSVPVVLRRLRLAWRVRTPTAGVVRSYLAESAGDGTPNAARS
jgi:hypothetical protein